MYQALYRKYRPRTFEDVVGQEHITNTLRRQVETGRTSHAYLFVGTRGTGKTTCAKILARALNCEHPVNGDPCNECASCRGIESGAILDVAEIDAASNNGVDNIRAIRDEAVYSPAQVRKRVYIIDEVHMLSTSAFNALLKILEEPPEHLVFILATKELGKVPATILSRCQHFAFHRIPPEIIAGRLKLVARREDFTLTEGAAALLSRLADGSMRDALSLLDQCVSSDTVDEAAVMRSVGLMGAENTARLWELARSGDAAGALALFDKLYFGGAEPVSVVNDLLGLARDMLMVRVAPKGGAALLTGAFDARRLAELAGSLPAGTILAAAQLLQDAADTMKDARDKRTKTELALLKLKGLLTGEDAAAEVPAARPVSKPAPVPKSAPAPRPEPAPAPAYDDAPPPWEDADAPPEAGDFVPELPPEEAARPAPASAPTPKPAPQPAPVQASDWWEAVLADCAEELGGAGSFLKNRDNTVPELTGGTLVLHTRNGFVRMMLDTAAVKNAVARAASARLGKSVSCTVSEGIPETPAPAGQERDKLDDLLKFDGIVKFK